MIGWWIVIAQQTPEERDASTDKKAGVLASWEASLGGIDWLNELVKAGKAVQLHKGGYPTRYTAFARDVLSVIKNGPPLHDSMSIIGDDYVMPGGWSGNVTIHHDKIADCPPDQVLTIDAWDLD